MKFPKLVHKAQNAVAVADLCMLRCVQVGAPAVGHQVGIVRRHAAMRSRRPAFAQVVGVSEQLLQHRVPKHFAQHLYRIGRMQGVFVKGCVVKECL